MDKSWIEVGSRAGKCLKGGSRAGKKKLRKDGQKVGREVGYRLDKGVIDGWMKGG